LRARGRGNGRRGAELVQVPRMIAGIRARRASRGAVRGLAGFRRERRRAVNRGVRKWD
jgi:hypothetical protein